MAVDYTTGMSWYDAGSYMVNHEFPNGTVANGDEILQLCKEILSIAIAKKLILPHASGYRAHFKKLYQDHIIDLSYDDCLSEIYDYKACIRIFNRPQNYMVTIGEFDMFYSSYQPDYEETEKEINPPKNEDLEIMLEKLHTSLKEIYAELSSN